MVIGSRSDARGHHPSPRDMTMWVVTSNPRDFPGKFIVRRHARGGATAEHYVADTLDEVREFIPGYAIRFDGGMPDDPVIVEVWL